jgi:hydroxymethylglutaryl-CoA lyase
MREITIHEVGLRDGLQVEKQIVPFEQKVRWAEELAGAGIDILQLGSFVHPDKVPQMADTDRLFNHFPGGRIGSTTLSGLVLNERGLERGLACGVGLFCMGVSASDTHSRRNTGMVAAEALPRIIAMAQQAVRAGKPVQVSVQSAFGCGYEGSVPEERVLGIVGKLLDAGLGTISLADTAGHAHPDQVHRLFGAIRRLDDAVQCACHFHDTYGVGLANCCAALDAGVTSFESAVGGLGGCPFTALAAGNVCTEDMVHMFARMGRRRDIRLENLIAAAARISAFLGRELPGKVHRTGPVPDLHAATDSK